MGAAVRQRNNVVYLLRRGHSTFLFALFAQRMRGDVSITDSFPCPAVSAANSRVAPVLLITDGLLLFVLRAEPPIR